MINRMSIKEFRDEGYLQEVNRQFLHPLGLALEVVLDPDTEEMKLGGIWDCRDEVGGMLFDKIDVSKAMQIIELQCNTKLERLCVLGYHVQPIGIEYE